ncbi:MAG: 3-phosphoglycerate dehydrogenase [Nitrosopumilus sp. H8]|nr:MAG: 3-phosphoglycerate dehydrogenase [Nitrosopumilus sp. H13]RNJ80019.1 MAG: 3-phosphoglycerate dehydrogenase [Nitrosopumilus sp. H8]
MGFSESVLICDEVDPILGKILKDNGLSVTYEPAITPEQVLEKIPDYEIVVVRSRTKITADMIKRASKCKVIARVGVGLDNIDQDAAKAGGIRVINAAEGAMNAVAELVLGFMFSLARQTARGDRELRAGKWMKKELKGTELKGKYLGIVGLGNIGKRLGRLARALNMNIIGYDVVPIDEEFSKEVGLMKADLDTLLQSSDYVSIHVPLLDSTRHLFDAKKMAIMKKTAVIINTSRGGVVDEDALYDALKGGRLGGAALDVFEKEPAVGNRLAELDNVILTPHIGAQTREAQSLAANVTGEKIIQVLRGVI